MNKKVKFGIIGCGVISKSHAKAIAYAKDAEIIAVCDIIETRANELAETYGIKCVYKDYKEMLKSNEIDVVCICTPSGMHGEMCIEAAKNNKHIFCEKPIEITKEKLDHLITEVRKYNVKMGCVFQRRMYEESLLVKKAIEENKLGKIIIADGYFKYYRSQDYYDSGDWRGTWELDGGGALMNQGIHGVDLIQWLAGDVESVYAVARTQARKINVEDTAVAILKYKSGAIGVIEGATSVYPEQITRFEIHGDKGSIIFNDNGIIEWKMEGSAEVAPKLKDKDEYPDDKASHLPLINDMVDAVLNDRQPLITPEEGRKAVELITAIYESSRTGKEIYL